MDSKKRVSLFKGYLSISCLKQYVENLKIILKHKDSLLKGFSLPSEKFCDESGLCFNTGIEMEEDDYLEGLFESWEHYSGNPRYPVPHPTLDSKAGYVTFTSFYSGEYGKLRFDLANHLVTELEKDISLLESV